MALKIKSIPVLKKEIAASFIKNATTQSKIKATVDFSQQVLKANNVLEKSKIVVDKLI
jgi:hypothetical protein